MAVINIFQRDGLAVTQLPPVVEADAGKILSVNENGMWAVADGELPAVTEADSGKILSVDDEGKWVAAENQGGGSSGGGAFVINGTVAGEVITLDKTWTEINTAFSAGNMCVILYAVDEHFMRQLFVFNVGQSGPSTYDVAAFDADGSRFFTTNSADGYPVLAQDDGGGFTYG